MEVVEYRLYVWTLFLKGLLEIRVHVRGDSLYSVHPFKADVVYEIKDDLLALAVGNPEDMPGLYVDDVCGVAVTIMELELVNAEALGLPLWFDERCAIDGVFILQTLQIDRLDGILAKAGDLSNLFERIASDGEKVPCILQELCRDPVALSLKRHLLDPCSLACRAKELLLFEFKQAVILSKAKMPEITRERVVDVHHPTALRAEAVGIIYLKDTPEAKHAPPRR